MHALVPPPPLKNAFGAMRFAALTLAVFMSVLPFSACRPSIDDNLPEALASGQPASSGAASELSDGSVTPAKLSQAYLPLAGGTMTGSLNMGGKPLTNLATPSAATDAVTKSYVDAVISDTAYSQNTSSSSTWSSTSIAPSQAAISAALELLLPAGSVIAWAGSSAPAGWLLADGKSYSRTTYARLFARISTSHGNGTSGTSGEAGCPGADCFNVPDYRGRFLRGVASGQTTDPDRASRSAMNTGGNSGDNVGSVQSDHYASHSHGISNETAGAAGGVFLIQIGPAWTYGGPATWNTNASGGNETRPKNAYVNYIIKY